MLTEINVERLPSFSIGFERGEEMVWKMVWKEVKHGLCVVC